MPAPHEYFMQQALELAAKGLGTTAPNPMVGCVIVKADDIVARGYHERFGENHAEVNAIKELPNSILPQDCTLYVTLEPCSHFGKTPPCADLIIKSGFKKVVVGCLDVNPLVSGNGIRKLKEAGIEVITGILEKECVHLNRRFFTFHQKKRPYILLKWAQTADGFISRSPLPENNADNWISSEAAKTLVHQWRGQEQAILVGKNTVIADNPLLTQRLAVGKNPLRLVIDRNLELNTAYAVFNADAPSIVINALKNKTEGNIDYCQLNFEADILPQIFEVLYQRQIHSLIVEGGAQTLNTFIEQNVWDEARVFVNHDLFFEKGVKAPYFKQLQTEKAPKKELYLLFNT
jgi:diaminohydroxyphosphoribosylaminopyrimidine deaminase / 5-amino-6-(5-phosphoribosylamino)uracil reductase